MPEAGMLGSCGRPTRGAAGRSTAATGANRMCGGQSRGGEVQAALVVALLLPATLGASACGDGGGVEAPRRTATPAGARESRTPTASPSPSGRAIRTGPPRTLEAV